MVIIGVVLSDRGVDIVLVITAAEVMIEQVVPQNIGNRCVENSGHRVIHEGPDLFETGGAFDGVFPFRFGGFAQIPLRIGVESADQFAVGVIKHLVLHRTEGGGELFGIVFVVRQELFDRGGVRFAERRALGAPQVFGILVQQPFAAGCLACGIEGVVRLIEPVGDFAGVERRERRFEFRQQIIVVQNVLGGDLVDHPLARPLFDDGFGIFRNRAGFASRRVGEPLRLLLDLVFHQFVDHPQHRSQPDDAVDIALVHFGMFGGVECPIQFAQFGVGKKAKLFAPLAGFRLFGAKVGRKELAVRPFFRRRVGLIGNRLFGFGDGGFRQIDVVDHSAVRVLGTKRFPIFFVVRLEFLVVKQVVNLAVARFPFGTSRLRPFGEFLGVDDRRRLGVGLAGIGGIGVGHLGRTRSEILEGRVREIFGDIVDLLPQDGVVRFLVGAGQVGNDMLVNLLEGFDMDGRRVFGEVVVHFQLDQPLVHQLFHRFVECFGFDVGNLARPDQVVERLFR